MDFAVAERFSNLRKVSGDGSPLTLMSAFDSKRTSRNAQPQRERLMEIADKCPVHRTLSSTIDIVPRLER